MHDVTHTAITNNNLRVTHSQAPDSTTQRLQTTEQNFPSFRRDSTREGEASTDEGC